MSVQANQPAPSGRGQTAENDVPANCGLAAAVSCDQRDVLRQQVVHLGLLAERRRDQRGADLRRHAEVRVLGRPGQRRGDGGQLGVVVRGDRPGHRDDQIRLQGSDLLEVDLRGAGEHGRGGTTEQRLGPRSDAGIEADAELLDADRHGAHRQDGVDVGETEHDDILRRGRDHRGAVGIRDLHRIADRGGAAGRGRTRAGGRAAGSGRSRRRRSGCRTARGGRRGRTTRGQRQGQHGGRCGGEQSWSAAAGSGQRVGHQAPSGVGTAGGASG